MLVLGAQVRAVDWMSCEEPTGQQDDGERRLREAWTKGCCARRLTGAEFVDGRHRASKG